MKITVYTLTTTDDTREKHSMTEVFATAADCDLAAWKFLAGHGLSDEYGEINESHVVADLKERFADIGEAYKNVENDVYMDWDSHEIDLPDALQL